MARPAKNLASSAAEPARRDFEIELIGLHARILLRMPVFQLVLVAAIGWMAWPDVRRGYLAAWALVAVAIECIRMLTARAILRDLPDVEIKPTYRRFIALDVLAGLTLAITALWFMPLLPLMHRVLLETTLFVVATAGSVVTISGALMPEVYSTVILLGAGLGWSLEVPDDAWLVALLTLTCWVFLLLVGRESRSLLLRTLHMRHEKDAALASLGRSETKLRQAYAAIRRNVSERNRVMAAASHDLRQPLNALTMYGAALATHPSDALLATLGHGIEDVTADLGHILDELLHLASLDSGTYQLAPEPTDLRKLVADACQPFAASARAKGLAFETALARATLDVDRVALGRIVRNLVDNAIKFTEHGRVRVILAQDDGATTLTVEDSGCGISEAEQQQVFDEFYQAPGNTAHRLGVGLGLPITRRLCRLSGAELRLESRIGAGTRFTVSWLRREAEFT